MTALGALESVAWLFMVLGTGAVGWAATGKLIEADLEPRNVESEPASSHRMPDQPDSLGAVIEARNLFRIERSADRSSYDPLGTSTIDDEPLGFDRPLLTLVGIADGRNPLAIITGFPGVEGDRVVAEGDVISSLSVQSIRDRQVRVVGMDTVWVLTLKDEWGGGSD
jgi:hypothetical protein